ncbi:ABC transporter permease [Nocardia salmonicida]|uniref:ABC transporter permease n=1 Tax=Nocardia salmonicida TaxID=53431 RepID=UPI00378FB7EF
MTITLSRTAIPVSVPSGDGFVERRALRRLGLRKAVPAARLFGVILVVAAWAAGSLLELIDPRKLSAPWTVLQTGWELLVDGPLLANLGVSLQRVLIGMVVGVLIGTTLAVIAGLSRWGESLIDGPVQIKRAIPTLGLIPLMILWLGIGEEFKLVLITLGVVVHMYIQTHASLTTIDQKLVELSEVQGVSRAEFIRSVVLPGSLPGFFLGLRMSVTSAWLVLIVVETVNAIDGLGKMMSNAQNYGQADVILVGLVVYAIFGLASDSAIRLVERRVLSWRRTIAG